MRTKTPKKQIEVMRNVPNLTFKVYASNHRSKFSFVLDLTCNCFDCQHTLSQRVCTNLVKINSKFLATPLILIEYRYPCLLQKPSLWLHRLHKILSNFIKQTIAVFDIPFIEVPSSPFTFPDSC